MVLSAYFSPNFSIFFIYFFFNFFKFYKFSKQIIILLLFNLILSLPIFIYVFILDVNFFAIKAVSNTSALEGFNISNKIFIISSLIFFYLFPFLSNKLSIKLIMNEFKITHLFLITILFFYYCISLITQMNIPGAEFFLNFHI